VQASQRKLATHINREVPAASPRKQPNLACRFDVVFMSFHVNHPSVGETDTPAQVPGAMKVTGAAWVHLRVSDVLRYMYSPSH
jgi:hypothetical protein